jgi:hypothetical protein
MSGRTGHYCVLSGWMNTAADQLKFFRAVSTSSATRPSWLASSAGRGRRSSR